MLEKEILDLNIFEYNRVQLKHFLKSQICKNVKVKETVIHIIFSVIPENLDLIVQEDWFDKEMIDRMKNNHFLIFNLTNKFNIKVDESVIFFSAKNIIENHNYIKMHKYIFPYLSSPLNKGLINYVDEENCSLLSYAILTLEKNLIDDFLLLGFNKDIVDVNGYNLYDRMTLLTKYQMFPQKIEGFVDFMIEKQIPIVNSKLEINEKNMGKIGYAYYQNILREINLKKELQMENTNKNVKRKV